MHARHNAWLNATPKESEKIRREMYQEGSPYLDVTPLSDYEQHLLELWYECGMVGQGSGGIMPLEWSEIVSWANQFFTESYVEMVEHPRHSLRHKRLYTPMVMTHCTLLDWELQLIRKLSQEYSSEYSMASDPSRECPKTVRIEDVCEEDVESNADAIADALKLMFGGDKSA